MNQTEFTVDTPTDFSPVILAVLKQAHTITDQAAVVTLTGDLGAGKTTFTQQLAQQLGVSQPVTSPTFGIINRYELPDNEYFDQLVHIDAYRIEDIAEAGPLRLEELFASPRTLICVEWPENIAKILPAKRISLQLVIVGPQEKRRVIMRVD